MKLALICPCGAPDLKRTRQGMEILESWGFQVLPGPILQRCLAGSAPPSELAFLAAADDERREELAWALGPEVDACWVVRGGHGLTRLVGCLPELGAPRPVFGFSDVSALLHALQKRGWHQLFHCANVQTLPVLDADSLEATRRLVQEGCLLPLSGRWLRPGRAEGRLWGGNLCVLTCLCGTPEGFQGEGCILALEDVREAAYRLDRMLVQLEAGGAFRGLAGVALGSFVECGDLGALWRHWVDRWQVPVLADLAFGHAADNYPLALGRRVVLDQSQMSWVERSIFSGMGAGPKSSEFSG
ncbi:MAG: LD-carboxypeptidase [Candidatus Eremiobacteraeota bacterium]|nr:LD-carboxypeptidase [Candidatus Eremiobacteraeota bacterium]